MARLFPFRSETATQEGQPRVVDLEGEDADAVFSALSSTTAREIYARLDEEPGTPSDVADAIDSSIQNVRYHLEKLEDAGLVEVVDTWYSSRGNEMSVYATTDGPLIVTSDESTATKLKEALSRLLGGVGALAGGSLMVQYALTRGFISNAANGGSSGSPAPTGDDQADYGDERAENGGDAGSGPGTDGADEGGTDGGADESDGAESAETGDEGGTDDGMETADTGTEDDASDSDVGIAEEDGADGSAPDDGADDSATMDGADDSAGMDGADDSAAGDAADAPAPDGDADVPPSEGADGANGMEHANETDLMPDGGGAGAENVTDGGAEAADAVLSTIPPGLLFFLGGLTVLLAVTVYWYWYRPTY